MAKRHSFAMTSKPTMPGPTKGSSGPGVDNPATPDESGTASPVAAATSDAGAVPATVPRAAPRTPFGRGAVSTKPHARPAALVTSHPATPSRAAVPMGARRRMFGKR